MAEFLSSTFGQIIVQAIGFVAMALGISSFQRKERNSILTFQMSASVLWMIQFILLGGYTGAMQNAIAIFRAFFYSKKDKWKFVSSYATPALFIAAFVCAGLITFRDEGFIILLPVIAMTISTVALYFDNENTIRYLSLLVSPLWLIYNLRVGTIAGVICESITICSIIISLIRYRTRNTKTQSCNTTSE